LLKYDFATLTWQAGYYIDGFGTVTEAELNAYTYIAWPYAHPSDPDNIFVLGRMANPEFTTTLGHIITTNDAGGNWNLVEDGWSSAHASALQHTLIGELFAIQSTGSSAKLYRDNADLNLVLKSTLTFAEGVDLHALKIDASNRVVVAANGADSIMVLRILTPYDATKIGNITYDHATGAGVNALEILE
jgi:hypothetical protein